MKRLAIIGSMMVLLVPVFYSYSTRDIPECVDVVVFSYNRPLQLYSFLESLQKHCRGIGQTHIIYRASTEQFEQGYQEVMRHFTTACYHRQGANPTQDFKPLTLKAVFESPSPYVIFAVDDIVIKEDVDMGHCITALEQYNAYGFYLRLGKNLTNCYSYGGAAQPLPPLHEEEPSVFSWHFNIGTFDWNYPHTVDMTVYRKKDIESYLRIYSYHSPNRLEDIWNLQSRAIITRKGLCYNTSKIVNLPLNRVQQDYQNRTMQEWTAKGLLEEFLKGKKMDIVPLFCVHNTAAHMEYSPTFINR